MGANLVEMMDEYNKEGKNPFKEYVDLFKKKHGIQDTLNAMKCVMVQTYWLNLHGKLHDESLKF